MQLSIDIWSDIACPWCYVGKRKLEAALERFAHARHVLIRWHAFELDPSAPAEVDRSVPYAERLARKYRTTPEQARAMMERITEAARADGIEMRFDLLRASNTFDAHRLIHFADEHGRQGEMKERLLRAYFTEGALMSEHETLARLAEEIGLERDEALGVLASDRFAGEVRAEEDAAARLGIHGVPFFVFGGELAVSGAQPVETLVHVLEQAWANATQVVAEGAICGPDGC